MFQLKDKDNENRIKHAVKKQKYFFLLKKWNFLIFSSGSKIFGDF